jgi:hypothetical protein
MFLVHGVGEVENDSLDFLSLDCKNFDPVMKWDWLF